MIPQQQGVPGTVPGPTRSIGGPPRPLGPPGAAMGQPRPQQALPLGPSRPQMGTLRPQALGPLGPPSSVRAPIRPPSSSKGPFQGPTRPMGPPYNGPNAAIRPRPASNGPVVSAPRPGMVPSQNGLSRPQMFPQPVAGSNSVPLSSTQPLTVAGKVSGGPAQPLAFNPPNQQPAFGGRGPVPPTAATFSTGSLGRFFLCSSAKRAVTVTPSFFSGVRPSPVMVGPPPAISGPPMSYPAASQPPSATSGLPLSAPPMAVPGGPPMYAASGPPPLSNGSHQSAQNGLHSRPRYPAMAPPAAAVAAAAQPAAANNGIGSQPPPTIAQMGLPPVQQPQLAMNSSPMMQPHNGGQQMTTGAGVPPPVSSSSGPMPPRPQNGVKSHYPPMPPVQQPQAHQPQQNYANQTNRFASAFSPTGMEPIDLLQNRHILPPTKPVSVPKPKLPTEAWNSLNCSKDIFRCTLTKVGCRFSSWLRSVGRAWQATLEFIALLLLDP
jgi:protein transport protein SEC24